MLKTILVYATGLISVTASASSMIYRSGYSKETVIQGFGKTRDEAAKDALCSIPTGWELDPGNSPSWDCVMKQDPPSKTRDLDGLCSSALKGNQIIFSIPLVPTDPSEREKYADIKPWLKKADAKKEPRGDGWDIKKICGSSAARK